MPSIRCGNVISRGGSSDAKRFAEIDGELAETMKLTPFHYECGRDGIEGSMDLVTTTDTPLLIVAHPRRSLIPIATHDALVEILDYEGIVCIT